MARPYRATSFFFPFDSPQQTRPGLCTQALLLRFLDSEGRAGELKGGRVQGGSRKCSAPEVASARANLQVALR